MLVWGNVWCKVDSSSTVTHATDTPLCVGVFFAVPRACPFMARHGYAVFSFLISSLDAWECSLCCHCWLSCMVPLLESKCPTLRISKPTLQASPLLAWHSQRLACSSLPPSLLAISQLPLGLARAFPSSSLAPLQRFPCPCPPSFCIPISTNFPITSSPTRACLHNNPLPTAAIPATMLAATCQGVLTDERAPAADALQRRPNVTTSSASPDSECVVTATTTTTTCDSKSELKPMARDCNVNLDAPIFPQIGGLGAAYWDWVHRPSSRLHFRHFNSDIIEFFSATSWWSIPVVWLPVVTLLLCMAVGQPPVGALGYASKDSALTWDQAALIAAGGAVLWTLLEYVLHRFLFHARVDDESPFWITAHWTIHGQHHKFPMDKGRLVFPPLAGAVLATPFYLLFHALLPVAAADALMAGTLLGYVAYDLTHYYLHHGQPSPTSYLGRLKAYHRAHHYRDPDAGTELGDEYNGKGRLGLGLGIVREGGGRLRRRFTGWARKTRERTEGRRCGKDIKSLQTADKASTTTY